MKVIERLGDPEIYSYNGGGEGPKGAEGKTTKNTQMQGWKRNREKGAPSRSPPPSPLVLVHRPSQYVELELGTATARARGRKLREIMGAAVGC